MRFLRAWSLLARAVVVVLGVVTTPSIFPAAADPAPTVAVYDYHLGDRVFHVGNFHAMRKNGYPARRLAPLEVTGRVYAPADAAGRHLPLVVIAHGLFWTCANDARDTTGGEWPCTGGRTAIGSYAGYDYLGRTLAARGMVVVSISANGVNAGELGQVADRARASLVFEHLRLWQSLVDSGSGALAGTFVDPATGVPAAPDFRGSIDFSDVGLLGHSRGGRGMMWAAAAKHRGRVPAGVTFKAVFGMAAAGPAFMDRRRAAGYTVRDVPLMSWAGTCDATGRDEYNVLARRGHNPVNIALTVHGANHNNLNARWAAASGLPGAEDDALHPKGKPGRCFVGARHTDPTLGYDAEQTVAATYVNAFFARYLQGDTTFDAVLSGTTQPVANLAQVTLQNY
jgi:hypothetical protein